MSRHTLAILLAFLVLLAPVALIACGVVGAACLIGVGAIASYMASPEYAAGAPFDWPRLRCWPARWPNRTRRRRC